MNSNNRSLYYFTVVAETLNFTQAAKILFISQQALSKHIRRLEEEYNIALFERKPKIQLTGAGKRLLQYATFILREETQLQTDLQSLTGEIKYDRITASLVEGRARILLPGIYRSFRPTNRRVILSFVNSGYTTASKLLQAESINLYFGLLEASTHYGKQIALLEDQLYLLAPRSVLRCLPSAEQRQLRDIAERGVELERLCRWNLPWIMPWGGGRLGSMLRSYFESHSYVPEIAAEAYPFDTVLQLCELGAGIAIVFRSELYGAIEILKRDKMLVLPIENLHEHFTLGLVTYPEPKITRTIQVYVDCAVKTALDLSAQMDTFFPQFCQMQFPL